MYCFDACHSARLTLGAWLWSLALLTGTWAASPADADRNRCPNPGFEHAGDNGKGPLGWINENGGGSWVAETARTGSRSLRLVCRRKRTRMWTSDIVAVPNPSQQYYVSVWAKLAAVQGDRGAMMVVYHMDASGERIGQSAIVPLGLGGTQQESTDWRRYVGKTELTPEVRGLRVNLRLYRAQGTAWFDDVALRPVTARPIEAPVPLRRGLDLAGPAGIAILGADEAAGAAERIADALESRGIHAEVLDHTVADWRRESRDLIVLGNLATSPVCAELYRGYYTFEDLYFPGPGGYVLRPLVNPVGTGTNVLVIGASDRSGLRRGVSRLLQLLGDADRRLTCRLDVEIGDGYRGHTHLPWPASPPWGEIQFAADYLKSGDLEHARRYREYVLTHWTDPDHRAWSHLFYVTKTLSWELMHTCDVFSEEERLTLTNALLKHLRGDQGIGYAGLRTDKGQIKENHATRAARGFYFGWRHFDKYYRERMPDDVQWWRSRLRDFWTLCLSSSRSREDSLSQHAFGGSLDNLLDIALMEPRWSEAFWQSSRPRLMADRCTIVCNNLGQTVMLGDTGDRDYPTSVFAKLAYALNDGGCAFMIDKRLPAVTSTDEPLRGFNAGIQPIPPYEHLGLAVCPGDPLYFRTELRYRMGVSAQEGFDKLAFRSGFGVDDAYLLLDGVSGGTHSYDDVNTIGEFSANGRRWLVAIDRLKGPSMAFHNGVTVAREGFGAKKHGQTAELLASAQGEKWAYSATRVPKLNGVDWNRHILWLDNDVFFVIDEMQALEAGDFSFVATWRSIGEPDVSRGQFVARQDQTATERGTLWLHARHMADRAVAPHDVPFGYRAAWDGILVRSEEVGDFIDVPLRVPADGRYALAVLTCDVSARGIVHVSIDGTDLGGPVDMYAPELVLASHEVGSIQLAEGDHRLRLTVTGRNPASTGAMIGFRGVMLHHKAESGDARQAVPNRFWQQFPPSQAATLERDTERLGPDLPYNPYADRALNILEQTSSRSLSAGEATCFQNVFHARRGRKEPAYAYRRLNDHCALVRDDRGVALLGASVDDAEWHIGELRIAGRMFYLGPAGVILHQAEATIGNERVQAGGRCPESVTDVLNDAWETTPPPNDGETAAWADIPVRPPSWQSVLEATPRSVIVRRTGDGSRIDVGLESGKVVEFRKTGHQTASFRTGSAVHALATFSEAAEGTEDLLVGSDDEILYRLGVDLAERWRRRMPFVRFDGIPMHWTLRAAKIRGLLTADLKADGRPEILVGTGSMHLHCLDGRGHETWRTPVPSGARWTYGIPDTLAAADVFGDGTRQVLVGNGLKSYSAWCTVLDADGSVVQQYKNGGWAISCTAIAAADLDRDGTTEVFCGNNLGDVRCFTGSRGKARQEWWHNLSRTIRSFTVLSNRNAGILVVGSDSGYLCAFDAAGNRVWGHALSSAVLYTAAIEGGGVPLIVAACRDGRLFVFTETGSSVCRYDLGGQCHDMAVGDVDSDGREDVLAVTSSPDRLTLCPHPR